MKFAYVQAEFWSHARRHNWDEQTRTLALYLLTSPHRTTEGLFHLPLAYAAHDLQYPIDTVSNTLSILLRDGFAEYDFDNEIVLLVTEKMLTRRLARQQ